MRDERLARIARQHLKTVQLLGVDFVPVVGSGGPPSPATTASPATAGPPRVAAATVEDIEEKAAALERLRQDHDAGCPHCTVATGHTRTVFGEGSPDADLMFVGEAPGAEEDRTGRPFVGRAGRKLDEMIEAIGSRREAVYIANTLKSRPPNNRTPQPDEVARCSPYLAAQIRIIRPRVIVALGGPAAKFMLQTTLGITRLRGQWGAYVDGDLSVDVMPTFHPAYLLRNYTRDTRQKVWSDLRAAMERIG
jgi:DNA polymerase